MKIYRLDNIKEIYTNDTLLRITGYAMFNPTFGRIKSAAESVYSKEQGRFYVAKDEDYVGIVGVKRTDNKKVDIMHIAVDEPFRNKGIGRKLIEAIIEIERVEEIHAETDGDGVEFYRKFGFKIEDKEDKYTGILRYVCVYKCN